MRSTQSSSASVCCSAASARSSASRSAAWRWPASRFATGGYVGEWLASWLAEYLNRTGSIIVILTLSFLAVVLSTQLSLGRMFSSATKVSRSRSSRIFRRRSAAGSMSGGARASAGRCSPNRERHTKRPHRFWLPREAPRPGFGTDGPDYRTPCRRRRAVRLLWASAPGCRRTRRCHCPIPSRAIRAGTAPSRFHRWRCSMRRRPSGKSTSAS